MAHSSVKRARRQLHRSPQNRNRAPENQNHHHHSGDGHNLQRLLAGFVDALRILPPEVDNDDDRNSCREVVVGETQGTVEKVHPNILDKPREVLPGRNRADRAGQDVVEQQGRDRELGQGSPHGFFDDAIDAAAHEHAAGFNVKRPHGVAEQHDRENEPRCALADDFLGVAAGVIGGGCQVGQNDRRGAPERDEGQHHRSGDEDLYCRFCTFRRGSHASGGWQKLP